MWPKQGQLRRQSQKKWRLWRMMCLWRRRRLPRCLLCWWCPLWGRRQSWTQCPWRPRCLLCLWPWWRPWLLPRFLKLRWHRLLCRRCPPLFRHQAKPCCESKNTDLPVYLAYYFEKRTKTQIWKNWTANVRLGFSTHSGRWSSLMSYLPTSQKLCALVFCWKVYHLSFSINSHQTLIVLYHTGNNLS